MRRAGGIVAGQSRSERECGDQAARIGAPGAGNVERGPVVGRGTHERQAKRDVDGVVEGKRFDGDQSLIVIHRKHRVIGAPCRLMKQGICGKRSARVDTLRVEPLDRWTHDSHVLVTQRALPAATSATQRRIAASTAGALDWSG